MSDNPEKPKKDVVPDIKIDDILLKNRQVFLYEDVNDESSSTIVKQLIALDSLSHDPICFWINSPGGSVCDGLAIMNVMKLIKSKVITIINSEVCSMGGHISVCGDVRFITRNGCWMAHDLASYVDDYSLKIKDRAAFLEKYYKLLEQNLKKNTKLTATQINKARTGELWLFANDCLKYGVVDKII